MSKLGMKQGFVVFHVLGKNSYVICLNVFPGYKQFTSS